LLQELKKKACKYENKKCQEEEQLIDGAKMRREKGEKCKLNDYKRI
jgi:hypothetical protein